MENTVEFESRDQLYGQIVKDLNLQKIDEVYYPHNVGSYVVTFSAEKFLIRYGMDRLQLFIFIASNSRPTEWLDLVFLKNFINKASEINPDDQNFDLQSVKQLNKFLIMNYDLIAQLLDSRNHQNTFDKIKALLKEQYINKHPGVVKEV